MTICVRWAGRQKLNPIVCQRLTKYLQKLYKGGGRDREKAKCHTRPQRLDSMIYTEEGPIESIVRGTTEQYTQLCQRGRQQSALDRQLTQILAHPLRLRLAGRHAPYDSIDAVPSAPLSVHLHAEQLEYLSSSSPGPFTNELSLRRRRRQLTSLPLTYETRFRQRSGLVPAYNKQIPGMRPYVCVCARSSAVPIQY